MQRHKDAIIEGGGWLWLVFSLTIKKKKMSFWLLWTDITVCDVYCCSSNQRLAKNNRDSWFNLCYFL